jgi:hypothetical protein
VTEISLPEAARPSWGVNLQLQVETALPPSVAPVRSSWRGPCAAGGGVVVVVDGSSTGDKASSLVVVGGRGFCGRRRW